MGAAGAATGQEALAATSAARFAPAAARKQHVGGQQQHTSATGSAAGRRTLEQRRCSSRPDKQGVVVGASRACSGATGWVCVRVCVAAALPGLPGRVCTILKGVCVSHVECVPENGDGGLQLTVVFRLALIWAPSTTHACLGRFCAFGLLLQVSLVYPVQSVWRVPFLR